MGTIAEVIMDIDVEKRFVHALRSRLPWEACGVVVGTIYGETVEASGFRLIRNAAAHPAAQFSFHPGDWIEAFFEAQKNQREIVGLFHSHPTGTVVPSASDLAGSLPWKTYWIVGLGEESHEIGVFARRPAEERWTSLPLRIVSAGSNKRTGLPASSPAGPQSV